MFDESAICIQIPAVVKARPDGVSGRRIVEVEASNEVVDSEGDVILQNALLNSANSFLKGGHLDIDHISEIGDRLGIANPTSYIVGNPLEVKNLGGGRTAVIGELDKSGRPKATELWESLKADPPVRWQASIYGFPLPGEIIDCRVQKAENTYGATRFLVQGIDWRSLAFTRNPINTALKSTAHIVSAKSLLAVMKARMGTNPALEMNNLAANSVFESGLITSPRTDSELLGHFHYHISKGKCPCMQNASLFTIEGFRNHFEKCCGDHPFDALNKARILMGMVKGGISQENTPFSDCRFNDNPETLTNFFPGNEGIGSMPATLKALIEDILSLGKGATPDPAVKGPSHGGMDNGLDGIRDMKDMWTQPNGEHSIPSRNEIVTGPAERASGGGVGPMIGRYSDFSAQAGMTALYERFDGLMRDFQKSQATVTGRFNDIERVLKGIVNVVAEQAKGAVPAAGDPDSFLVKAESKISAARRALRKAEMEEDEHDREERKSRLTQILDILKSAVRLLSKAEDEGKDDDDKMEKAAQDLRALKDTVTKALAVITKAEDEEKEEKEAAEKAKSDAEAAAKAKADADAAAAKAEESSAEEEKKDDTAKAVAALPSEVQDAMKAMQAAADGNAVMTTTLKAFMDTIMNASKVNPAALGLASPPAFVKSDAGAQPLDQRAQAAIDSGALSSEEGIVTQGLIGRFQRVQAGQMDKAMFDAALAKAPPAVRELFQAAA